LNSAEKLICNVIDARDFELGYLMSVFFSLLLFAGSESLF